MPSSSNSSSLALLTLPKKRENYEVFVTFRGEDTRYNITDFLFSALEEKRISVFRDDTNLPKGESIGPELLRAIEDSQIFVVIFSKNYASSTWCLQELEKILECVQVSGKHVLPVFYDVDPSEVRNQSGIYGEAFVKHEKKFQQDYEKVQQWRKALKIVGSNSGWDVRDKPQSAQIKEIVQRIINILDDNFSCASKGLVGMDSPIQELQSHLFLNSVDDVRAIGICGMGGIGKTTLAAALYDRVSDQFDASCFINDVSKVYRSHSGPFGVQKEILHQTVGKKHNQLISNNHDAIKEMQRRLGRVRTLLILDNVNHVKQLEIIPASREWLRAGSRIIIISRDEQILRKYGVDVVYQVPLLNETNCLELFCRQAFKLDHILNSYEGLVSSILHYTNGLPLAIEVLGSFLHGRDISEWISALYRLRESPDKGVMDVLQLSFDGLEEDEKEIFLHIACFFNFRDADYVKNVLNCCGFHAEIGMRILIDKSLIRMVAKHIEMHNLLKELGIKIARETSSKESRKWKRLWHFDQFHDVTSDNMENNVEAVVLRNNIENMVEEEIWHAIMMVEYFSNLRMLIIWHEREDVNASGSLICLSDKLRYVEWTHYPFMYLPSSFQPIQLVELILTGSNIEQLWEDKKYLPKLKKLWLCRSKNLIEIPNFEEFPNLEVINLEGCVKLGKLDPSIGHLTKIFYLNLASCESLINIPYTIFGISSLKYINMTGCSKLSFNNDPGHLNIIKRASHFQSISPSSNAPYATYYLHHIRFPDVPLSPEPGTWLYFMSAIDISYCGLSQVPDAIGCLRQLQSLDLGGNNFASLPSLKELSKLVYLNLNHCKFLKSLPQLPSPTAIAINWDLGTKRVQDFMEIGLHIFNCPKLGETEFRNAFSWMKQLIHANPQFPCRVDIVIPGSEIPSWFNNQSEGDRILIDCSPIKHDINNDIIGLVSCSLFSMEPTTLLPKSEFGRNIILKLTCLYLDVIATRSSLLDRYNWIPVFYKDQDLIRVKTNHIWLTYLPWKLSGYVLDFHGTMDVEYGYTIGLGRKKVKNCGYGWLHKQDLQEFNLIRMHPEL